MNFDQVERFDIYKMKVNDKSIKVQWQFIRYSDWIKGKINPLKDEITPLRDTESITFPPNIDGLDLLKR